MNALSEAITALNEGRGDFFAVAKSLALFVNALHKSDQQFVELNSNLAEFTDKFNQSDQQLATTLKQVDGLLSTARKFVGDNGSVLAHDVNNLADVTNALLQPEPRDGLETALHVFPNLGANLRNIYEPAHGALTALPVVASFANPMQFICSSIQAGSRLGYQESAELCAQYLAPILDAIKFNFPPFGVNMIATADTLPKYVAYSEPRLQPPPGYKDTTVPGIWSRDTLFSHGNHEPGWIVAPGMQGVAGAGVHREHADARFAGRTDGRPGPGVDSAGAGRPAARRRTPTTRTTRCRRRGTRSRLRRPRRRRRDPRAASGVAADQVPGSAGPLRRDRRCRLRLAG